MDVNSAHYDPKTRTMRANPYEHTGLDTTAVPFAGDNFVRYNGDVVDIAQRQVFAWDATSKGEELHAQADPTLAEKMYKRFQDKRENFKATQQKSVLEKYVLPSICVALGRWSAPTHLISDQVRRGRPLESTTERVAPGAV